MAEALTPADRRVEASMPMYTDFEDVDASVRRSNPKMHRRDVPTHLTLPTAVIATARQVGRTPVSA